MFIKLSKTEIYNDDEFFTVYINMNKVEEFFKISSFGKPLTRIFMGGEKFEVKETPEEIMALIEQSKFKVTSGTVTTYSPMTFSAEV